MIVKDITEIPTDRKVVLCHGVFDFLHLGHIRHLRAAKSFGDILVVSITDDAHVMKGCNRPIFNEDERAEILDAIENQNVEKVSFDNELIKSDAGDSLNYLQQKKQISINMKQADLNFIKQRANDIGISYQNIIQALVNNYTTGKVQLTI